MKKITKTIKTKTEASPVTMTYEQAVKLKFSLEQMRALGIEIPKIKAKSEAPVVKSRLLRGKKSSDSIRLKPTSTLLSVLERTKPSYCSKTLKQLKSL